MSDSTREFSYLVVAEAPPSFGGGGGGLGGGGFKPSRADSPCCAACGCVLLIVLLMVLIYLHLRVVLSCSNCGSRATRGQWQRREGCPTCGSDLHT